MPPTVLLVDDDTNVVNGLVRALHHQPFGIYTARSGEEAMWILKTHHVDVVVTDEQMPGLSGTALLAWVAATYPEVTRILLTGHASVGMAVHAINDATVYKLFVKPCKEFDLAVAIRRALEQKNEHANNAGHI
jgi:two-component system, probable response regulator PhcQ